MATLSDLPIKSILDMDDGELLSHFMKIRSRRRIPIKKTVTETNGRSKSKPKEKSTGDLLNLLTPEMAKKLLGKLTEDT